MNEKMQSQPYPGVSLADHREAFINDRLYWNHGGPVMAYTRDQTIDTPDGPVAVRYHLPTRDDAGPALVYLHGGGFALGNLETHDRIMRTVAHVSGATVVGVDYALSPEAKFPVALRQCVAVVRRLRAGERGVDPARIGLGGDGCGAMLALATSLCLRDEGDDDVTALLLYCGQFYLRQNAGQYLADPRDVTSPYVDCLGADLTGLPPTFIAAAELDPLSEDSVTLAGILDAKGVTNRHTVYPGALHSFIHNSRNQSTAERALRDGAQFFFDIVHLGTPIAGEASICSQAGSDLVEVGPVLAGAL